MKLRTSGRKTMLRNGLGNPCKDSADSSNKTWSDKNILSLKLHVGKKFSEEKDKKT